MSSPFHRRIFISYRIADDVASLVIPTLRNQLKEIYGDDFVFWDKHSLLAGRYDEQLAEKVKAADAVIVLIGKVEDWKGCVQGRVRINEDDDWVKFEVALALRDAATKPEKKIVPLLVMSHSSLPAAAELPVELAGLIAESWQGKKLEEFGAVKSTLAERVSLFCSWLAKAIPLPFDRQSLVNRLMVPLKQNRRLLVEQAPLNQWRPLFWTAAGILPGEEREMLRDAGHLEMLTHLAASKKNLSLLRFLALCLGRLNLPRAVVNTWDEIINEAVDHPEENGWNLDAFEYEKLIESVKTIETVPRLRVHLETRRSDVESAYELAVSGSLILGWDDVPLTLNNPTVPWSDDLSDKERRKRLEILLARIRDGVFDMVGDTNWDDLSIQLPRLELYLEPDQMHWEFDCAAVDPDHCAGQVFRVTRRLYHRHFREAPHESWKIKSRRYQKVADKPLGKAVKSLATWQDLTADNGELAFEITQSWDASATHHIAARAMVAGLWLQSEGVALTSPHLRAAYDEPRCVDDEVTSKRLTSEAWQRAVLLLDPYEEAKPYNSRCMNEEDDLDLLPV